MPEQNSIARVGDRVRVRGEPWLVTGRQDYEHCALIRLTGSGPDNTNAELPILTPFERLEPFEHPRRIRRVTSRRWRRVCLASIAGAGDTGVLHAATAADVALLPFQLEPALAIVRGQSSRVLLADDVGLGKTIQAGLITAELRARGAADRVLVLTPSGLRDQWAAELERRFGLTPVVMDMSAIRHAQRLLPSGVNPWTPPPIVVTSIDYVKRPEVLAAVADVVWDLVIVDEAHGLAAGSDRQRAAAALCAQAAYVLLLTATPHNGDAQAFLSLCETGTHGDPLLTFRRTRAQAGLAGRRRIHQLGVGSSHEERVMFASLAAFARAVRQEHGDANPAVTLALGVLEKRAYSSAFALEQSIRRRLTALTDSGGQTRQPLLPFDDPGGEHDDADDVPAWTLPDSVDADGERGLLEKLADAARAAAARETKLAALARLLRRLREPAIVFTEYRDTLMHLRQVLAPNAPVIHGGLTRDERRTALGRFAHAGVLLATDAAGEGLNLQDRCRVVINLELPWNPTRLEQRIGRVDRIGQTRTVHTFHLIGRDSGESRIAERLATRIDRARGDIGAADPLRMSPAMVSPEGQSELTALAAAETERLSLVRRLRLRAGASASRRDDLDGPLLACTRRRGTRALLRSWTLVVLGSTLVDAAGEVRAQQLTPLLVALPSRARPELVVLDALAARVTDPHLQAWARRSLVIHEAFWARRLARERAILRELEETPDTAVQPGLFDRRTWQSHLERSSQSAERLTLFRARIAAAERATLLQLSRPRPLLALLAG